MIAEMVLAGSLLVAPSPDAMPAPSASNPYPCGSLLWARQVAREECWPVGVVSYNAGTSIPFTWRGEQYGWPISWANVRCVGDTAWRYNVQHCVPVPWLREPCNGVPGACD